MKEMFDYRDKLEAMCNGNDYNKVNLLQLGDTVDAVYNKHINKATAEWSGMSVSHFVSTDLSKSYQLLEEKVQIIYKLSGLTLDDIIQRLARGWEFTPPAQIDTNLSALSNEQEIGGKL